MLHVTILIEIEKENLAAATFYAMQYQDSLQVLT